MRDSGGDAMKFLVQVRADRPVGADGRDTTAEAREAMQASSPTAAAEGVPSIIENLIYPLAGEDPLSPEAAGRRDHRGRRALDDLKPSLLKLEYPGSPEACRRLARALTVPWAVLSAGVAFDEFAEVLRICCDDGRGQRLHRRPRHLEGGRRHGTRRAQAFLSETGRRRMDEYVSVIEGRARPYQEAVA